MIANNPLMRYSTVFVAAMGGFLHLANATTPCGEPLGPDIIVADVVVNSNGNYGNAGEIDAFSWGIIHCNVGTANLQFQGSTANHPVATPNMFRLKTVDGTARFEQIGMGWVRHFNTALSQSLCCTCNGQGGEVVGVGCSDPSTSDRMGTQCTTVGGLGPRFEINPHSGAFPYPYMFRNNCTYIPHTSATRRCQVQTIDLNPALNIGATYYAELHEVALDDASAGQQDNNVSHKRINISGSNPNYTASSAQATVREQPAIKAWKTLDPTVVETEVVTPEQPNGGGDDTGFGILLAQATQIGAHTWRYEYALYNMNSDRAISSFSFLLVAGYNVTNIGFHDVAYHDGDGHNSTPAAPVTFDGTDWPGVYSGGSVSWNMVPVSPIENSNALRWGTLYNFRFDCNVPPAIGTITLGLFKPVAGQPSEVYVSSPVPDESAPCACPGDLNFDGKVDGLDIVPFTNLLLAQVGVTNCADVANPTGGPLDGLDVDRLVELLVAPKNDCE